ncbi:MAG TPA: hypothetical protein PKZ76_03545 [Xanthomonadaceae bacterium]|nr:hypothetical protein [Xanthomonadaceae bacterium]
MNLPIQSTLAAALLLAFAAPALADDSQARGEGPRHERGPIVIAEARERAVARAAEMDADGDGYISMEERQAYHEARRAERMAAMMQRRGIDPEAKVSVEDFVERRITWLEKLDVNGDGIVDREEMRAARDHRHGMRGEGKRDGKRRGERRDRGE